MRGEEEKLEQKNERKERKEINKQFLKLKN